jgi:hypothetical protein
VDSIFRFFYGETMAKIYTPNTWLDEELSDDPRFDILEDDDTPYKSDMQIAQVTNVVQAGTAVVADLMNNIEDGIDALDTIIADQVLPTYTTGGTDTAFTITTLAGIDLATNVRWKVKFHATAGVAPTLNRDGKGAKSLKYYDSTGAKVACGATSIIANMISDVQYDGTDYVVLDVFLPTMAASSDINTGTDITKTVNSDALAGANIGQRIMKICLNGSTALTTDDAAYVRIDDALNGMNLVAVRGSVGTGAAGASSSGTPTFTVYNVTDTQQMLSTSLTIDANEYSSATADVPAVIDAAHDDVATEDLIQIACTVAGTDVTYTVITLVFQLP